MLLTVGAVAWGVDSLIFGTDPSAPRPRRSSPRPPALFQLGLLGLLTVLFATKALGDGRLARFFIRFEAVLLFFAIGSTVADGIGVSDLDQPGWAMLDMFWPLSMLGMFFIGIRIADRRPLARQGPLLAAGRRELGPDRGPDVRHLRQRASPASSPFVHLCVGYGVLGQIVARKSG